MVLGRSRFSGVAINDGHTVKYHRDRSDNSDGYAFTLVLWTGEPQSETEGIVVLPEYGIGFQLGI